MNLKELHSFKLSDAVTFHNELNPKLWHNNLLRPEVKKQLKIIADDFLQELGISGLDVKDITISGSNAAYSYTKHSDLDLHILVDMGELPDDEVYRELFDAKKTIYNDMHDIKIHGIPVELYVQDSREPVISLGEYSIMDDDWKRIPTKRRSDFDQTATKQKYNKILNLIEIALQSRKYSKVKHIIDTIKRYRQAGLDKGGEFGPENLAFKMLRSQGYITKLYDLRDKLHSEKLSFETMYQNINEELEHIPPVLYHATYKQRLKNIKLTGLGAGGKRNWPDSRPGVVYLALDPHVAESYAETALDDLDADWDIVILQVSTNGLDPNKFYLDSNVQDNEGDTVEYHGIIPPSNISLFKQGVNENEEEKNHWYDAGVRDAIRGARPNPRSIQHKLKANHPEEVYFYMNGYKSVKQGVAEGLSQNQGQVRQTLNAWMNQDQQYKDPTQRKGFQAKVWPYIQQNIKTILADKGEDGKGSYPASPFAAWLLVQHMDAYPQNQGEFLQQLAQSGLDPTDGKGGEGKLQFLKDRYEVNKWIAANANNEEYFINDNPLPNPTVNVRNPAMFKDAGQVATSRKDALDNAIAAGNKLLVAAVQATNAQTQPSYKQGVAEDKENHNLKLDEILYKLCNIVKKEIKEKTGEHAVAACIIDPNNRIVAKTSKDKHGRWIHAEHNAIDTYEKKYGEVPEGSIIVTTLSPCNEYDDRTSDERFGESCTDYINSKGIKKVYCGYMDPTQDNYNREFNVIETSDNDLRHECKKFADTFLKNDVKENYTMQFAAEKTPPVSPYAGVKDNQYRGGISEATQYKEIEFVCANPEFPDATDPELQQQMYQELKKLPGVIPLFQDQGHYSEGQKSLTAIFKDADVKRQILKLSKSLGVTVDLIQPVSDRYVDRAIRGEHEGQINEASGYIPSEKEKNDPRFKTALTVDVHPDSIKKNAKAFYWNTSRAGIPPTANPNGKI